MSTPSPYARFLQDDLILRDVLAVDRTIVANERTFLGYVRTTLALLAAGGSLIHFFDAIWALAVGFLFVGASVPLMLVGTRYFIIRRRALLPFMKHGGETPDSPGWANSSGVG